MEDCLFCKIALGTVPSKKVYDDESVCAFYDIKPAAPVHVLIIPKKHIASLNDAGEEDWETIGHIQRIAQRIAGELGVKESGYRLINNCGEDAGQIVHHVHYHLLGGEKLDSSY
jgi:histidine triad (HIT) family protein